MNEIPIQDRNKAIAHAMLTKNTEGWLSALLLDSDLAPVAQTMLGFRKFQEYQLTNDTEKLADCQKLLLAAAAEGCPTAHCLLGTLEKNPEGNYPFYNHWVNGHYDDSLVYLTENHEEREAHIELASNAGACRRLKAERANWPDAEEVAWYSSKEFQEDFDEEHLRLKAKRAKIEPQLRVRADGGDITAQRQYVSLFCDNPIIYSDELWGQPSEVVDRVECYLRALVATVPEAALFLVIQGMERDGQKCIDLLHHFVYPMGESPYYIEAAKNLSRQLEKLGRLVEAVTVLEEARAFFSSQQLLAPYGLSPSEDRLKSKKQDLDCHFAALVLENIEHFLDKLPVALPIIGEALSDKWWSSHVCFRAGLCFLRGEGGERDIEKARESFLRVKKRKEAHRKGCTSSASFYAQIALQLSSGNLDDFVAAKDRYLERLFDKEFMVEETEHLSLQDSASLINSTPLCKMVSEKIEDDWLYLESLSIIMACSTVLMPTHEKWRDAEQALEILQPIGGCEPKLIRAYLWLSGRLNEINVEYARENLEQARISVETQEKWLYDEKAISAAQQQTDKRRILRLKNWIKLGYEKCWGREIEAKNRELQLTNQKLATAKAELEDMMAMFAHKFRGPVDSIISNAEHPFENRDHLFKDLGRTMNGLLDIFSFVSTHSEKLLPRLQEDNGGPHGLTHVLHKALWLTVVQLLTKRNIERMNKLYFMYALKEGRIPANSTFSDWRRERPMRDVREAIRTTWEMDIGAYGNFTDLEGLLAWLASKLVVIQVDGVSTSNIRFSDSGTKESLLLVILTEILVNAIKHYEPSSERPIQIRWSVDEKQAVFSCENPTSSTARKRGEGGGRGLKFLSMIARNVAGEFRPPGDTDDALVAFSFPIKLFE